MNRPCWWNKYNLFERSGDIFDECIYIIKKDFPLVHLIGYFRIKQLKK